MSNDSEKCYFCGKPLVAGETLLCNSCVAFIEWKYSSLERFEKQYRRARYRRLKK